MAIIFVSTKKKQQMLFWLASVVLLLILGGISFFAVWPVLRNPSTITVQEVFSAPDVKINFEVLDSLQVQQLEPFLTSNADAASAGRANPFIK